MEERIMDEDELRGIKVKRNAIGGIEDAVEEGTASANEGFEEIEAEYDIVLPEVGEGDEEYDESLVGLTPEDLRAELERRKKVKLEAEKKCAKHNKDGEERLRLGNYQAALPYFEKALSYEPDNEAVQKNYWVARTRNFKEDSVFEEEDAAIAFTGHSQATRAFVLEKAGERLKQNLAEAEREAEPLRKKVHEGMEERRAAFAANKKYYVIRTAVFAACFVAFLIVALVFADRIVRTQDNLPIILTAVFGGLAFLTLLADIYFVCKLAYAIGLCRANENLSSTEDGARLEELEQAVRVYKMFLAESL